MARAQGSQYLVLSDEPDIRPATPLDPEDVRANDTARFSRCRVPLVFYVP